MASVRCSKNTKYIGLVWIKAVQECRWTSDDDLFICWQKALHFFHRTGSKVDQLEQDSLLLLKSQHCFVHERKTFHEQRKGRSLGQTVGSLQLILALSVVQIWVWCPSLLLKSELYLLLPSGTMTLISPTFRRFRNKPYNHCRYFSDLTS